MRKKNTLIFLFVAILVVAATLAFAEPSWAGKLQEAIAKTPAGVGKGHINSAASPGFLGIPGAPHPFWLWGVLWAIWVGWIFSTVGAFGGIMAGVGHITMFGLGDYGKAFKKTSPMLNKLVTDSIRVSNQWLVGLAALISSIRYQRMGRIVLPLGLFLGAGSVAGAILIPVLTAGKIRLSSYIGYFGLCVFVIAIKLFYDTTEKGQAGKKQAKAATKAFEDSVKARGNPGGPVVTGAGEVALAADLGAKITDFSLSRVKFTFYGVEFSFNPVWPVLGGLFIAALASFLGIGGGFLYVPFLTSIAGLPMFIVAGTSAVAVLIGMVVSIFGYMVIKGVPVDFALVGFELIGIAIGAYIGPYTSKYIPERWLKRLFVVLALYVGVRYTTKGFLGHPWLPPY